MADTAQATETKPALTVVPSSSPDDEMLTALIEFNDDSKYLFAWQHLTEHLLKQYDADKLKELIDFYN